MIKCSLSILVGPDALASSGDHLACFSHKLERSFAEDFLEAHHNATEHGDRAEQNHQELLEAAFSLRDEFAGEGSHAGQEASEAQSNEHQEVAVGENQQECHQQHHAEEQFDGQAEEELKAGAVVAAVPIAPILTAPLAAFLTPILAALPLFVVAAHWGRGRPVASWLRPVGNELTVFVVVTVVDGFPVGAADVAELVAAAAGHVVTALVLLNHKFAPLALAVVQVVLEELKLLVVAQSCVASQQTLGAELLTSAVTAHGVFLIWDGADDALAVLPGTEFGVGVVGHRKELVHLAVVLLDVGRQLFEKVSACVQQFVALVAGAGHFFEVFDLIDDVVVEAGFAEGKLVLAVAHVEHFVRFFHLLFTDLAVDHVHEPLDHTRHALCPL